MNLLILSPGRRCELVKNFKRHLNKRRQSVITVDMDKYAPALYFADKFHIVEKDFDNLEAYITKVIKICKKEGVGHVMTLIDPELALLARYAGRFKENKVELILSGADAITATLDKYLFFQQYKNDFSLPATFRTAREAAEAIKGGGACFPLMAKLINGSASIGNQRINSFTELDYYSNRQEYIFQEYLSGREVGVDVYFDTISGKIVSIFMKEKICMRSGETDKAFSIFRPDVLKEVMKLEKTGVFKGPVDIDMFLCGKKIVFLEINPRFGGGYPLAHYSGVDFVKLIVNNINGIVNKPKLGGYDLDTTMMKCNKFVFKSGEKIYEQ